MLKQHAEEAVAASHSVTAAVVTAVGQKKSSKGTGPEGSTATVHAAVPCCAGVV